MMLAVAPPASVCVRVVVVPAARPAFVKAAVIGADCRESIYVFLSMRGYTPVRAVALNPASGLT